MGYALANPGFVTIMCGKCGIEFSVPYHWQKEKKEEGPKGDGFFCPNGHPRVYSESEVDRLKRELEEEQRRRIEALAQAEMAQRKLRSQERIANRLKTRVAHGLCPCCNRSFQNLRRHMETKHPDFEQKVEI